MIYGLNEKDINQIDNVFRKYPEIQKVLIFGSRSMGNFKAGSDIDLALVSENSTNGSFAAKIKTELEDLSLPYLFDVVDFKTIKKNELIKHIEENGKLFYEQINS